MQRPEGVAYTAANNCSAGPRTVDASGCSVSVGAMGTHQPIVLRAKKQFFPHGFWLGSKGDFLHSKPVALDFGDFYLWKMPKKNDVRIGILPPKRAQLKFSEAVPVSWASNRCSS